MHLMQMEAGLLACRRRPKYPYNRHEVDDRALQRGYPNIHAQEWWSHVVVQLHVHSQTVPDHYLQENVQKSLVVHM